MEVLSIYEVTDFQAGKTYREEVEGSGQDVINFLRKEYSEITKFVLKGFKINGNFKALKLNYYK